MESKKEETKQEVVRCFIALDFPREIVSEIERVQKELDKKKMFIGKLAEPENLHLTLKFLGEIEPEKIEKIKLKLGEIKLEKFMGYLGELGVFSSNFIKIVWARILGKKVEELQKQIDEKLEGLFEKEERFMSHLTIARVKKVKDKKVFLQELEKINVKNLGFSVEKFYLFKSELKETGSVYTVLEEFNLI